MALDFLRDREDVVIFGAQAVNAYVEASRMTQDVDVASVRGRLLADELRDHLVATLGIAARVLEVGAGRGFRLYQMRKSGNRHLADIRPVETLPAARRVDGILMLEPSALLATKVMAYHMRRATPKAGTDWRDIAVLLLAFPELKTKDGPVRAALRAAAASAEVLGTWDRLVEEEIGPEPEDGDFA